MDDTAFPALKDRAKFKRRYAADEYTRIVLFD